jgi:hypothetical protein
MAHWQYGQVFPDRIRRSLGAGFDVICAPSMWHWGDVIHPNAANLKNLDEMIEAAGKLGAQGILGVVNTWWVPWRGFRDAAMPIIAYTGRALRQGRPQNKRIFMRSFTRDYFGLSDPRAAKALWALHESPVSAREMRALLFDSFTGLHDALALAESDKFRGRTDKAREDLASLRKARGKVAKHRLQYRAVVLAGRVKLVCLELGEGLLAASEHCRRAGQLFEQGYNARRVAGELGRAEAVLGDMLDLLADACRITDAEWNRTRYPRDAKKSVTRIRATPCRTDSLLGRLVRCRRFLDRLLRKLRRGITACHRGGFVPTGL